MSLIAHAAYLKLCECGEHGRIVTAKNQHSPEFGTKHDGFKVVEIGAKLGFLSKEEALHLREELRNSKLENSTADPLTEITVNIFNASNMGTALAEFFTSEDDAPKSFFTDTDPGEVVH